MKKLSTKTTFGAVLPSKVFIPFPEKQVKSFIIKFHALLQKSKIRWMVKENLE